MPATPRIRVEEAGGVRVVRFLDRQLFDDRTVRETTEQVHGLLPKLKSGDALVLDFSGVQTVSSSLVAKLVLLQRRVDVMGASLRLCELNQMISSVLRTTNLDRVFAIDRDLRESLSHFDQGSAS